ncbi:MAG TPA: hypothetical protein VFT87_03580 [Candidatus Saccharimonadales bacterium]|nr:hypothetical protein [Candidatus Saccharimonadales bacterium]
MTPVEQSERSQLPVALGIAVGIALVMTVVSVAIYQVAGFYELDLSRPGYETVRADIDDSVEESYDTTSPLTKEALDEILSTFDTRIENLKSYGDFGGDGLSDDRLLISE